MNFDVTTPILISEYRNISLNKFFLPGHDRYYNKYINVKKGGIGGVAMLLAGYVAISYLWEYDHISKTFSVTVMRLTCVQCHVPRVEKSL